MSSSRVSSQRRKPRRLSPHRVVVVFAILFFIAYYAATLLLWRLPGLPEQPPSQPAPNGLALNLGANVGTNEQVRLIEERMPPSRDAPTPRAPRGEIAVAPGPPIALSPAPSPAGRRPTSVILTAPTEVAEGSTFQVSVALPPGSGVHSAHFRLSYDDGALELLDMMDANGTTLPVFPSEPGSVELDLDVGRGAEQAPAIRFLARTGTSRSVEIAVAAELWDQAGNALPSAALTPRSITVDP
jgi:hypothetical protein